MSSSSWAEEAQFTAALNAIKAPSGSKIKRIAELAVEHSRHYKHVVYAVERLIRKAQSTPQTIAGLYCIDAIVRHSRHSHSSQQSDVYVVRFSQHLAELLLDVVERCGNEGKQAIRKLCRTWKARSVFDAELVDRMLEEVGEAEEEEADEEGTEEERDRRRREKAETDSEDESEERKRPEPAVRPSTVQPPQRLPPSATVLPPSQHPPFSQPPQPALHTNTAYYPPSSSAPLLPTPSQPSTAYAWQQHQQSHYPPPPAATQPTAIRLPSYAALLGDDDDDEEDEDERVHKMRQRLEAEKLKLSQPTQPPTQPPPPPTPPPQPPQPPPTAHSTAGMSGQSGYEYEQKRSRFGAPKSRDEVEAAMAAHGGPTDGRAEQHYRPPPATDFHRTPSNSFSPPMSAPASAAALPPSYAPPPPSSSSFDSRPRHHSNSSTHPGLQLSSDQSNCPPGLARVVSTVLFIGHGKLETSSHPLSDWLATLTSLCQPHGQLAAIRYVPTAGAHFATFATRGQAEAALAALQRQRVLDRELKLGWGKSKGMDIQRFDSETGDGLVDGREAERASLEWWTGRERSVPDLMREQTEQRTRGSSSNGAADRGHPSSTPPLNNFTPSAKPYQPPAAAVGGAQPFSPPSSTVESARLPFHHPSRPPPVFEHPPSAAAPPAKHGPSPSVAAFLASVLPPATGSAAAPTYPSPYTALQQYTGGSPQQPPLLPYPSNTQYPPPPASNHSLPYHQPAAAPYAQNGHGGSGSGVVSDPWEARKRLRWDEGQQSYQQHQQQQLHGDGGGVYPPY